MLFQTKAAISHWLLLTSLLFYIWKNLLKTSESSTPCVCLFWVLESSYSISYKSIFNFIFSKAKMCIWIARLAEQVVPSRIKLIIIYVPYICTHVCILYVYMCLGRVNYYRVNFNTSTSTKSILKFNTGFLDF